MTMQMRRMMTKQIHSISISIFVLACVFGAVGCGAPRDSAPVPLVSGNPTPNCSSSTIDSDIINATYAAFATRKELLTQIDQINVTSQRRNLRLVGYTNNQASHDLVTSLARNVVCVQITANSFTDLSPTKPAPGDNRIGTCTPPRVACGDICVEPPCNLGTD